VILAQLAEVGSPRAPHDAAKSSARPVETTALDVLRCLGELDAVRAALPWLAITMNSTSGIVASRMNFLAQLLLRQETRWPWFAVLIRTMMSTRSV